MKNLFFPRFQIVPDTSYYLLAALMLGTETLIGWLRLYNVTEIVNCIPTAFRLWICTLPKIFHALAQGSVE